MTDLRQAAQAVIDRWDSPLWKNGSTANAIADLRTALEQQAEPVAAESITDAMMNLVDRLGSEWKQVDLRAWQHLLVYAPQQQAEPVAYIHRQGNHWEVSERFLLDDEKARGWTEEPIYTTPPQRKPLTDEAIWLAYQQQWHFHPAEEPNLAKGILQFARAIEAAHNIKEGT